MTVHKNMFKQPTSSKEREKIDAAFGGKTEEWQEGPLKELLVNYVGTATDTEDVTTEMIVQTLAQEFPEFLMVVAEENWIRGYQQAIHDVDQGQRYLEEHAENNEDGTT